MLIDTKSPIGQVSSVNGPGSACEPPTPKRSLCVTHFTDLDYGTAQVVGQLTSY
jgi:hypothetical protein